MNDDKKVSGHFSQIEYEMLKDQMDMELPRAKEMQSYYASILKSKYDALVEQGFTQDQAMQIVCTRPLLKEE